MGKQKPYELGHQHKNSLKEITKTRKMRSPSLWTIVLCLSLLKLVEAVSVETKMKLVGFAQRAVSKEEALYELRSQHGLDKRTEDFTTIEATIFDETAERAVEMNRESRLINWIAYMIREERVNATVKDILDSTTDVNCPFEAPSPCVRTKYRSVDGTCNNLQRPLQGASFTPFIREIQAQYEACLDGTDIDDQPRMTGKSGPLPGARTVSTAVHNTAGPDKTDTDITAYFTFWGQFIAHMVSDRAIAAGFNLNKVDCCSQSVPSPRADCFNIPIPANDPFRAAGRTCISFQRSLGVTSMDCLKGSREQLNTASSYIDGSAVYGTHAEKVEYLRTHSGGELATSEPNELPYKSHPNPLAEKSGFASVRAGDPRAPEVAMLTGLHTIWVREHNRIARGLAVINRFWGDEKIYQETRRIIVALIQHITYNEWLPVLLGSSLMKRYDLFPRSGQYYNGYNPNVDASTSNVVSTAAFRFGHSLLTTRTKLCNKDFSEASTPVLRLRDLFFRSNQYLLHEQSLMRGLLEQPVSNMDAIVTRDVIHRLVRTHPGNGGDLAALNIQRGRDHGLPSYNTWRRFAFLSEASSFTSGQDGFENIPEDIVQRLAAVYSHPDDVDIWTGGVSEKPTPEGLLGPLFSHLMGNQFSRYRQGDRFWYETPHQPQAFTLEQLEEIRSVSFARIVCNSYEVDKIQPHAFRMTSAPGNKRMTCAELRQINLLRWRE